ncbi:PsaB [Cucumis melo var. makuwa]|uniref:PsaB (Chloroplast) n=1 Tax=Cucumis melo var. makuwa TaxID=1194695 RepID=A0A5A7UQX9_CUCMM|nr:PsaB [Cucumis melo var. makuwa]
MWLLPSPHSSFETWKRAWEASAVQPINLKKTEESSTTGLTLKPPPAIAKSWQGKFEAWVQDPLHVRPIAHWWYTISLRTNGDLYTRALFLLFLSAISLIAGLFRVRSLAWTGHLVHVTIPISMGGIVQWKNFLDVLPHPQGLGPLLTVFWMFDTIGCWKHITLWQSNVSEFHESSTYLMEWLRDYLWLLAFCYEFPIADIGKK